MAIFNRSQQAVPGPEPTDSEPQPREARASSGSELKRVVDAAAERVDEIVNSAEQVAAEIIAGAEVEAARYVEGRRREADEVMDQWSADLRGLAELLGRQENRLRELTEAMIGELGEISEALRRVPPEFGARSDLATAPNGAPEDAPASPPNGAPEAASASPLDPTAPSPASQTAQLPPEPPAPQTVASEPPRPSGPKPPGREHALLRAAQMAVAGSSRDEIEHALRADLGIDDPEPIVDDLLGARS